MAIAISLTVHPDSQEEAVKAVEVLSRTATGLAFDGLSANISFTSFETED